MSITAILVVSEGVLKCCSPMPFWVQISVGLPRTRDMLRRDPSLQGFPAKPVSRFQTKGTRHMELLGS